MYTLLFWLCHVLIFSTYRNVLHHILHFVQFIILYILNSKLICQVSTLVFLQLPLFLFIGEILCFVIVVNFKFVFTDLEIMEDLFFSPGQLLLGPNPFQYLQHRQKAIFLLLLFLFRSLSNKREKDPECTHPYPISIYFPSHNGSLMQLDL